MAPGGRAQSKGSGQSKTRLTEKHIACPCWGRLATLRSTASVVDPRPWRPLLLPLAPSTAANFNCWGRLPTQTVRRTPQGSMPPPGGNT